MNIWYNLYRMKISLVLTLKFFLENKKWYFLVLSWVEIFQMQNFLQLKWKSRTGLSLAKQYSDYKYHHSRLRGVEDAH